MTRTKDEEINKILTRAEKYREQYKEKITNKSHVEFNIENDIGEIFKEFFGELEKDDYNNMNNIFINCKLNQDELKNGCTKKIKFLFKDKYNKNNTKKMKIKIPQNIKEGQKIIIHSCGNYIKETNKYSNLVINIITK